MDWEEILLNGFEVGGTREQYEQLEYTEPVTVETKDLIDHLREQLQMMTLSPRQLLLAEEFLGNINEEGLPRGLAGGDPGLRQPAGRGPLLGRRRGRDGARRRGRDGARRPRRGRAPAPAPPPDAPLYTTAEVEEMLAVIQKLDPPGMGARDLRECLLIQLGEQEDTESLTYRLVHDAFPDLIAHRWNDLAKRFGVEPAAVQAAADELARLDPKPGLKYANQNDGYIIPDLIVEKIGTRYQVFLNDTGMPRLRLSRSYQEIARDKKKMTPGEPRVHRLQDEQRELDDSGHRAAAPDHAQGDELHRGPAAGFLREGHRVPQAAHPARGGRSDQHARVHGQPGDQREVRADAPRGAPAQVLLLQRARDRERAKTPARARSGPSCRRWWARRTARSRSPTSRSCTCSRSRESRSPAAPSPSTATSSGILPARMRKRV